MRLGRALSRSDRSRIARTVDGHQRMPPWTVGTPSAVSSSAIVRKLAPSARALRICEPELFTPVARELVALYLAQDRPSLDVLVFPDAADGHLRRQNWRRRVWIPALERAGVTYFRSYDLRHTCATLLLYEGRTLNEVAEHLGHSDLHRPHLRPRHARRLTAPPRPDRAGDPDGTCRRRP